MSPNRWQQLKSLLEVALERPPAEQRAFLHKVEREHPDLHEELSSLLEASEETGDFLEHPLQAARERIGPYRLLRPLDHAGMSIVYLAERADGAYHRHVVVKFLPFYFSSEQRIARFRNERQILASLSHPNIASLIDGGVTAAGYPYLVMEHVDGSHIIDYCAANQCSLDERLRLLQEVCAAIQYAHRNLVVHRDLKPANILVTQAGQVKLLDFGIAKLLEHDEDESIPVTRTGQYWMTPEYAAPEQLSRGPITTAVDVYQIGVLACQLITGRRPFRVEGRSLIELERVVVETPPPRPSALLQEADLDASTLPTSPAEWKRQVRGDLDTIVLNALRKEPTRRYASAEALAADLQRYREDRPVEAHPASRRYRLAKFVRRHKQGVATVAVVALLMIGFVGALVIQHHQISQERDRAQTEMARAEAVADYLAQLFQSSDPSVELSYSAISRDLLERGLAPIDRLSHQPAIQAELLDVVGRIYRKIGLYDQSGRLLEQALGLRLAHQGFYHVETAASFDHLGLLLSDRGHLDASVDVLRQADHIRNQLQGPDHVAAADTKFHLAYALRRQGKASEAEQLFRESLTTRRRLFGELHPKTLSSMSSLGVALHNQGRYDDAETLYETVLEARRRLLGPRHPDLAMSLNNLGSLHMNRGRFTRAQVLLEESLDMRRSIFGPSHPKVALTMNNLAIVHRELGNFTLADSLFQEALTIRRKLLDPHHTGTALSLLGLGELNLFTEHPREAREAFEEALASFRHALPEDHTFIALTLVGLGAAHMQLGNLDAATPLLEDGFARLEQHHPAPSLELASASLRLGQLRLKQGRYLEADSLLRSAYTGLQEIESMESVRQRRAQELIDRLPPTSLQPPAPSSEAS